MLIAGILSFCQLIFLPGYLLLRLLHYRDSRLSKLIYSFALSLLVNYLIVYALVGMGVYKPQTVLGIVVAEWTVLASLVARDNFRVRLHARWGPWPGRRPVILIALSLATVLVFLALFVTNIGSVFALGDDAVSWDRWARDWASGINPRSGYYPQLLPANWSLTYVMLGTTDVQLFAKAIMPLFSLGTLLLFADRFRKTKAREWLIGLNLYGLLLCYLFDRAYLASGYADIPVSFYGFLAFCALLEAASRRELDMASMVFPIVFAAAAVVTKQPGIYCLLVAIPFWMVLFRSRRTEFAPGTGRYLVSFAAAAGTAISWWMIVRLWAIWHGTAEATIANLGNVVPHAGSYGERILAAAQLLAGGRGGPGGLVLVSIVGALVTVSMFSRAPRWVVIAVAGPYTLIWALFFSYELRNLALAIPFIAYAAGAGVSLVQTRLAKRLGAPGALTLGLLVLALAWGISIELRTQYIPWIEDVIHWWIPCFFVSACILSAAWLTECDGFDVDLNLLQMMIPVAVLLMLFHASALSPAALLSAQLQAERTIGITGLNKRLYDYDAEFHLKGKIATDYWFLGELPQLRSHFAIQVFPDPITPEVLDVVAHNPGVDYLLMHDSKLSAQARTWLATNGVKTEFVDGGFRFVSIPWGSQAPPKGTLSANPNPVMVCDGSGLGTVSIGWAATGVDAVAIKVDAPDSDATLASGPTTGQRATGKWVSDGVVFYLQDITGGAPLTSEHTLASVIVHTTTEGCAAK